VYLPIVSKGLAQMAGWTDCSQSGLGAMLFTWPETGDSSGPTVVALAQDGYTGLAPATNYSDGELYFADLAGWDRGHICQDHNCLRAKAERGATGTPPYEYLAYGPERMDGVPDEEKYNLPWATEVAREIADQWNKKLMISYSTKQLHQEAEERGYDWNDPSQVVAMLAPYGDLWLIQAADEYWRLDDGTVRPVLSQRVYPPGPEFRAEVERWVGWIRDANPEIEIWIQLAMQRIGIPDANQPSAELLLEYREWIVDLVDGVYMMPIYGNLEQFPIANEEMAVAFRQACEPAPPVSSSAPAQAAGSITLVEEGWTDSVTLPCPTPGQCATVLPGYYYRLYENSSYPCGAEGYHQFMVVDQGPDPGTPRHLFAKYLGGAVGLWYYDETGTRTYYPQEQGAVILTDSYNRNMFFRSTVSEEFATGVTRKVRDHGGFRILISSYCSHDLYHGQGEGDPVDGFQRWGYSAAMEAFDYVQQNYATGKIITYGGSAGAAGSFFIGKDQDGVDGIVMDSMGVDLSAISSACHDGINVFGGSFDCFCPDGGPTCMEALAPRIGFTLGQDEPHLSVEAGFDTPIYYVWNERDASLYAYLHFQNMHEAIEQHNPGGSSVANMVCINDPRTLPGPTCNLHCPSIYDFPDTASLVEEIYRWILDRIDTSFYRVYLPVAAR
jgi:hypothetical protein